jgi:hypothetical protein
MAGTRFPIKIGRRSAPVLRVLFGVRRASAFVELDGSVLARFGRFETTTPLTNVVGWRIEGPWRWITAIGVRLSLRHGDLTYGGTHEGGVRLDFRQRVRSGPFRIPALYVTVADPEALAAALSERGIPGVDARRRHR